MKIIAALSLLALVSACGSPEQEPAPRPIAYAHTECCVVCNALVADPCIDTCVAIGTCDTSPYERTDGSWCACSAD